MRSLPAIGALSFLAACQPSTMDKAEVDPPATPSAAVCVGAGRSDCVVYRSGPVKDAAVDWDRGFLYQLQGTGAPGSGDNEYCKGGYCAVAILKRDESGRLIPVAHVESTDAQWYETPEIVPSPAGPLIVARSNSLGTGAFNDDVVLRTDEAGKLRRIDVNSWKTRRIGWRPTPTAISTGIRITARSSARPGWRLVIRTTARAPLSARFECFWSSRATLCKSAPRWRGFPDRANRRRRDQSSSATAAPRDPIRPRPRRQRAALPAQAHQTVGRQLIDGGMNLRHRIAPFAGRRGQNPRHLAGAHRGVLGAGGEQGQRRLARIHLAYSAPSISL